MRLYSSLTSSRREHWPVERSEAALMGGRRLQRQMVHTGLD